MRSWMTDNVLLGIFPSVGWVSGFFWCPEFVGARNFLGLRNYFGCPDFFGVRVRGVLLCTKCGKCPSTWAKLEFLDIHFTRVLSNGPQQRVDEYPHCSTFGI